MARIGNSDGMSVLRIKEFLGVNEDPDGDTKIKTGELSEMRNFRITQDGHLQIRPGTRTVVDLRAAWDTWRTGHTPSTAAPVFSGVWEGMAGARHCLLCAFGGVVFDVDPGAGTAAAVGVCTQAPTSFFGFGGKVYLLNGHEYKAWSGGAGDSFADVEGYIPTVRTAATPAGEGTDLENVNRLNGLRRVRFSPDGTAKVFQLPEKEVDAVTAVEGTAAAHTDNPAAGTVTFAAAPAAGTNTVCITYRKGTGARAEVTGMRFAELFNGASDARVFLYGDGTNKTVYSGLDRDGTPTAEYFPDLYEAAVGESNTPVTGLVRHFDTLLVFKRGSAYAMRYGALTLDNGVVTAGFTLSTVNRAIGCDAMGQARLVENDPLTLDGGAVYQWRAAASAAGAVADERSARRISDRVRRTMAGFDFTRTAAYNDRRSREFWFLCGGRAAVYNYANDRWFLYTDFPAADLAEFDGALYAVTEAGRIKRVCRDCRNDDGAEIDAYAATGSMDFDREWLMKYSAMAFVSLQPEVAARVDVTVESNRRSDYPVKTVAAEMATFSHMDFRFFSFNTNRKPQVKRLRLKVKKAAFCKLIFRSRSASAAATVLEADVRFRPVGNVK